MSTDNIIKRTQTIEECFDKSAILDQSPVATAAPAPTDAATTSTATTTSTEAAKQIEVGDVLATLSTLLYAMLTPSLEHSPDILVVHEYSRRRD